MQFKKACCESQQAFCDTSSDFNVGMNQVIHKKLLKMKFVTKRIVIVINK